ncbi:DUF3784 domain-containing protein [Leptotrichia buccalis]|uniref:Uncharacterized protein n=1 Tax=Leptotrichia buccalis (strain ATCC 14201 / DSM 1135 / JCM 12969 / NCTC 10249 / C-1013-b) TaxID=523794 RepID=C7NBI4_LEPBD|nr:DUF3784 domain-containing protein [Leptotrichia buccalis]ACV39515.1 hypothetical protein Lebu_1643 [Leptotrichia buccalis C-1013-b]
MSKIKYSSQWQVEKLEHEYFKEMKEDHQQQLALSQENQFNDYQYDYYSAKDENYYDKLKKIQRKIAKINHDNYKEFDNFSKSEDIFLKYWENIKKNYRIIYEIEKELIKMEEEIHPSLYMPAIIDDNKGEFQKFIDNLKKEIDEKLLLIWEYEKPLFRYRFDILLTDFERKEKEIKTLIETHEKTINKQLKETKDIEEKYRELINEQKKYDKKILEIMGIFLSIFSVIGLGVSSLSKLKSNYFSTWSMICGTILITISGLFYLINFNEKVEKKTLKILIPGIIGLILIIIGVVCRKFLEI